MVTGLLLLMLLSHDPEPLDEFFGTSPSRLPDSRLSQGLINVVRGPRTARDGGHQLVPGVLAEDKSCTWLYVTGPTFGESSQGWFNFSLPSGTTPGRELFHFVRLRDSGKTVAFSLSQAKQVQPALAGVSKQRMYRDTSDIIVAVDRDNVVAVTSEDLTGWMEDETNGQNIIAASLIDVTARGETPSAGAAIPDARHKRGERVTVAFRNGRVTVVEAGRAVAGYFAIAYEYDTKQNRIRTLPSSQYAIPLKRNGRDVAPRLYDLNTRKAFYDDYLEPKETRGKFWTEWNGKSKRWSRFAVPPGEVRAVLYARGMFLATSYDEQGILQLYEASTDRKRWKLIGPYIVHARNGADDRWLVQRTTDGALFLADFRK